MRVCKGEALKCLTVVAAFGSSWGRAETPQKSGVDVPTSAPVPGSLPYEVIPLDLAKKGAASTLTGADVVEQKGLGSPVFPDTEAERKRFEMERTSQELCKELEGKLVAYVGETAWVEGCRQRAVRDIDLLNELLLHGGFKVVDIPAHVFRAIPPGAPLGTAELRARVEKHKQDHLEMYREMALCKKLEGSYATVSGEEFFLVEKCRKRPFRTYQDLVEHNTEAKPVMGISPAESQQLKIGEPMVIRPRNEQSLLYRIDGDVVWSRLYGGGRVERDSEDSFEKLSRIEAEKTKPQARPDVCKSLGGKVVSFFSKIYFIDSCQRRLISVFSLELQQTLADGSGVVDMTSDQYRALQEGKDISAEEVLKRLK